ncbi:MAG: hypothetical protein ACRC8S_08545 [Fimbriiglobus sp.]
MASEDQDGAQNLTADHMLICRNIWFDNRNPHMGFGLGGIYIHVEPPEGYSFPFRIDRMFIYVQLWGTVGEFRIRTRMVRIDYDPQEGEFEFHLGHQGLPREFPFPSPRMVSISGIEYVQQIAFPVGPVPFREPGVYEFQIWVDGIEEPVARERILAKE